MKTKCSPECNLGTEIIHQVKNEEIHIQCGLQIIIICQYRLITFDKCATLMGFPSGSVVKNLPASAGDPTSISGSGRSPGGGHGNLLQYSCLENPMDRGAWRAAVHEVKKEFSNNLVNKQQQNKFIFSFDTIIPL